MKTNLSSINIIKALKKYLISNPKTKMWRRKQSKLRKSFLRNLIKLQRKRKLRKNKKAKRAKLNQKMIK